MNVKVRKVGKNTYTFTSGTGETKLYELPYEITEEMYGFTEDQWKYLSSIIKRIWENEKKNLRKNGKRKTAGYHEAYVNDSRRSQKDEKRDPKK